VAIRVRLLGTAAGGGLPQWNCACDNCLAARAGRIPSRTQSSVALSADGRNWFLVNASPDLRAQIERTPALHPWETSARNSPIAGVLLTNADLDHVLGLILLREGEPLPVLATEAVRETLIGPLGFETLLGGFCGIRWEAAPTEFSPLRLRDGSPSSLFVRAIFLPGGPPRFDKTSIAQTGHSVAYQIRDQSGASLLMAPDVAEITSELQQALEESDAVIFDGTFWVADELRRLNPDARTAQQMGHLPIRDGSLELLRRSPARWKIFTHINNTNPILATDSLERTAVLTAGVLIGEDGLEFEI
jgi:pyrroloquinoline quinone biosynthesis protein B